MTQPLQGKNHLEQVPDQIVSNNTQCAQEKLSFTRRVSKFSTITRNLISEKLQNTPKKWGV
jgi:hypothetical protein